MIPNSFLGKRVYNDSELELLRTTVMCKTLTESERYTIMEQAVAPCPEITMIIKGQKVWALLDMGSQVTLMKRVLLPSKHPTITPDWGQRSSKCPQTL